MSEDNSPSAGAPPRHVYPDPSEIGHSTHVSPYIDTSARAQPPPQPYNYSPQHQQQQQQHRQQHHDIAPHHQQQQPPQQQQHQGYAPQQHRDHTQDNYGPVHHQQYSYDNQLRYPAPPPPFPIHGSAGPTGPYEHSRSLPVPLPPMNTIQAGNGYASQMETGPDTTGQVPPPGVRPRVTATLWEDESTLCFQVDVNGTCVARREDNRMINGTKLLNVVGMTRGRRDGILKAVPGAEKHVVKIGPMHLKGVWISFERALAFANQENITQLLYPLFVLNIGALLQHPVNSHQPGYHTSAALAPSANMYPPAPNSAQIPRTHEFPPSMQQQDRASWGPEYRGQAPVDYGHELGRQQSSPRSGQNQLYNNQNGASRIIHP